MLKRRTRKTSEPNGPILGLAAVFAVSLVLGLLFGGVWSRFDQRGIHEEDYVVLVSLVYARDGDLRAAADRLALLGKDTGAIVASVVESYPRSHPDAQAEARALRQLANAIDEGSARSQASVAARGDGGNEAFSPWTWLGVALILICAAGIGGPLSIRLIRATKRGGNRAPAPRSGSRKAEKWRNLPERRTEAPATADTVAPRTHDQVVQPPQADTYRATPHAARPARPQQLTALEKQLATRPDSSRWNGPKEAFILRYRHGVDPFDEVHPIVDPATGELVGACGMSSQLGFEDSTVARHYAMAVWAQDYISNEPLKCIGLVSKYSKDHPPAELTRWIRSGVADDIVSATPRLRLVLETTNLRVEVNVLGLRYGIDVRGPEDNYFSELEVEFLVQRLPGVVSRNLTV